MKLIEEIHFTKLLDDKFVIFNLINGAADYIDEDLAKLMMNGNTDRIDVSVKSQLLSRNYAFNSTFEYQKYLAELDSSIDKSESQSTPNFLVIPTYSCNLACTYCYEMTYEINNKRIREVSPRLDIICNEISEIVSSYKSVNNGVVNSDIMITLMGGEPLMKGNEEYVVKILSFINENGYSFNVVTNGIDLNRYLDTLKSFNVSNIQITLDGARHIHDQRRIFRNGNGSFDNIMDSIEQALQKGVDISLRINVDSSNIDSLPKLASELIECFGDKAEQLKPYIYLMQDGGCSGDSNIIDEYKGILKIFELEQIFPQMKIFKKKYHSASFFNAILNNKPFQPSLRHCGASMNQHILDFKGNRYKCWHGIGNDDYRVEHFIPGNEAKDIAKEKSWLDRKVTNIEKCKICKYRYICGTGCPAGGHTSKEHFDLSKEYCVDYSKVMDSIARTLF